MENAFSARAGVIQSSRISATAAGYMELSGAKKDADCRKVKVEGGVSKELGCCNKFEPESKAVNRFRCGDCEYLINAKIY